MAELGPLTCAGCGLLCDDVIVEETGLRPACGLGAEWFARAARAPAAPAATIAGRETTVPDALERAAALLRGARRPLLYGFEAATVEDARAAVALADALGAIVSPEPIDAPWPGTSAVGLRGASTATLGEIRDRSRVVVIWREDPETTHPRLLERLGLRAGRDRTLVVVDDRDTPTAAQADLRLRWAPDRDLEALVTLRAVYRGLVPGSRELRALLDRLAAVEHLAIVHGSGLAGERRTLALHELVRALSDERHVVTLALPRAPGTTGARDVVGWQTGYRGTVDLVAGYPEQVSTARRLATEAGVDVALRVEGEPARLADGVPEIALGGPAASGPAVTIRTAPAGVGASGTVHRLDGVPLTLQAPRPDDTPTAAALLARLLTEVTA